MSTADPVTDLRNAVQAFKVWANERFPADDRYGEWECEYEDWPTIERAFNALLSTQAPEQWTDEVVELLLYALARDNETERLKNALSKRRAHLIALAQASRNSTEHSARWQLADALGDLEIAADVAEPLLEQLFDSGNEYVSRRALGAMGRRRAVNTETYAKRAWETGLEYQRMMALGALSAIGSPRLDEYLRLADEDGREYLAKFARELQESA